MDSVLAYEHELIQQPHAEETQKKRKGNLLKVISSKDQCKNSSGNDENSENLSLMVKKFGNLSKDPKTENSLNLQRR